MSHDLWNVLSHYRTIVAPEHRDAIVSNFHNAMGMSLSSSFVILHGWELILQGVRLVAEIRPRFSEYPLEGGLDLVPHRKGTIYLASTESPGPGWKPGSGFM